MADSDDFEVRLDGELTKRHLFALVLEFHDLKESEAERKLQVGRKKIGDWMFELKEEGLVEVSDEELGDARMRATKEGMKKFRDLEKTVVKEETPKEIIVKAVKARVSTKEQFEAMRGLALDLALVSSTLISLFLLRSFFQNPNMQAMSFFTGSVILSLTLVFYQQYKKSLKTRDFISFFSWSLQTIKSNRQYVSLLFVVLLMVYAGGMLVMNTRNYGWYVILSVVAASSVQLIYSQKKTMTDVLKFYAGVLMIVFGLVLTVDMLSITGSFFGYRLRVFDFFFGLGMLLVVYMNEKELGLTTMGSTQKV